MLDACVVLVEITVGRTVGLEVPVVIVVHPEVEAGVVVVVAGCGVVTVKRPVEVYVGANVGVVTVLIGAGELGVDVEAVVDIAVGKAVVGAVVAGVLVEAADVIVVVTGASE